MSTAAATSSSLYASPPRCTYTTFPTHSSSQRTGRPSSKSMSAAPTRSRSLRLKAIPPERVPIPPRLVSSHHLQSPESIFQRSMSSHATPSAEDENWLQDTVPIGASANSSANNSPVDGSETNPATLTSSITGEVRLVAGSPDSKVAPPSPPLFRERTRRSQDGPQLVVPSRPPHTSTRSASDPIVTLGSVGYTPKVSTTCYFSNQH